MKTLMLEIIKKHTHLPEADYSDSWILKCMEEYASQFQQQWVDARKQKPEKNVSVFVFIPGEDEHVTTGMWDVSNKWVLLDEYRVPTEEVTYWRPMIPLPEDKTYTPSKRRSEEEDTTTYKIRQLQMEVHNLQQQLSDKDKEIAELRTFIKEKRPSDNPINWL